MSTDATDVTAGPARVTVASRATSLLSGVTILVAILSLAGYLARASWLLELACHFRLQFAGLLALCGLVLTMARRRRVAALAAIVAVLHAAAVVPIYFAAARPTSTAATQPLRCLSLNVLKNSTDYDDVLELIRREEPDIVVLVEVTQPWIIALADLERRDGYTRVYHPAVVVYSRFPLNILKVAQKVPGSLPSVAATFDLYGQQVTLIGTHPYSPDGSEMSGLRNVQLAELAQFAGSRSGPVVVLGDLNVTGWSPYFQDLLRVGRLRDSRQGYGIEPSWPTWLPPPLRIPIDHCLVSEDIAVTDRRLAPATESDHLPIIVDLALPTPQATR